MNSIIDKFLNLATNYFRLDHYHETHRHRGAYVAVSKSIIGKSRIPKHDGIMSTGIKSKTVVFIVGG